MTARVPGACAKFRVMPRNVSACICRVFIHYLMRDGKHCIWQVHAQYLARAACILHVSTDHIILIRIRSYSIAAYIVNQSVSACP